MPTTRPRVAIALTYGLSVRYLVPTGLLDRLVEVCDPVVALGWDDPELAARIERTGATAARLPDPRQDGTFRRIERLLEAGHERRLRSRTVGITRRWRRHAQPPATRVPTLLRQTRDRLVTRRPGAEARLRAEEAAALPTHTNVADYSAWLVANRVDAVVTMTPYHRADQLLMWAAEAAELPALSTIISFDNPTTRGRIPVLGDRVLVWNQANRSEIERAYPDLAPGAVRITGAPQFDLHRDPERIVPEAVWRDQLAIPHDRPVILYGAGPEVLLPDEPALVRSLDEAIEEGRIPGRPVVLLRSHPADPVGRWRALAERDHILLAPGWGRADGGMAWPSDDEIDLQMSTLAHSAVHVSICSSMAIDGAAFDRPVITPTFVPAGLGSRRRVRALYRQEHWQAIARSGGVTAVGDQAALERAIGRALADPHEGSDGRALLMAALVTFDDGRASTRVAAELADLLRSAAPDRPANV